MPVPFEEPDGRGGRPSQWAVPMLLSVVSAGAGSRLPVDVGIRVTVVVLVLVVLVRVGRRGMCQE